MKKAKNERRNFLKSMSAVAATMTLPPFLVEELKARAQDSNYLKILPDDSQWRSVTQPYNRRYLASSCRAVYMPRNTDGVQGALKDIISDLIEKGETDLIGMRQIVGIKGGGHCYQNHVFNSNTLYVIDMVLMNKVQIINDASTGYETVVKIEGGATLWDVYNTVNRVAGLIIPGGVCAGVGAGGHFQGGGYGLNSRQFGLVVDYIDSLTSVIISPSTDSSYDPIVIESDKPTEPPNPDGSNYTMANWLFYGGTGGGGGNFGIVTEYTLKNLPHSPDYTYLAKIEIPWEQSTGTLFSENQMYELLKIVWASTDKDSTVENSELRFLQWFLRHQDAGNMECIFQVNYNATGSQSEIDKTCDQYVTPLYADIANQLTDAGIVFTVPTVQNLNAFDACFLPEDSELPPPNQDIQHETWLQGVETNSGIGPSPNSRRQTRSLFMTNSDTVPDCFTPQQATALHKYLTMDLNGGPAGENPDKPLSSFRWQIDTYGKKVHENKGNLTSFAHRDAWLLMSARSVWYDANIDQKHLDFNDAIFNAFADSKLPIPLSDPRYQGGYVNYPDNTWGNWHNQQDATYMQVYYLDTAVYQGIAKQVLDKDDFFIHPQAIYKPS